MLVVQRSDRVRCEISARPSAIRASVRDQPVPACEYSLSQTIRPDRSRRATASEIIRSGG